LIKDVKVATAARLAEYGNGTGEPERAISTEEKMKIQWIIVALFLTAAGITSVAAADIIAGSDGQGMIIGMPDPSAVWAGQMGYQYLIRTDDQGGQYGVIILPDGTERDAWEAYREYLCQQDEGDEAGPLIGMPNPSAVWADEMGYQYLIRTDDQGGQYGVIILPDGTERDAWEAYREYLLVQDGGSGQVNPGESMIGMHDPVSVWSNHMGSRYLIRTHDEGIQYGVIVYPDGTERDSWSAFRKSSALSRVEIANPAASLPGSGASSRQSLLERLLTK
jgi:putative hemolysin